MRGVTREAGCSGKNPEGHIERHLTPAYIISRESMFVDSIFAHFLSSTGTRLSTCGGYRLGTE